MAHLVEHETGDQRFASSSLTAGGVTVLCPSARHVVHCQLQLQPRKTCPDMTEKLLTGMFRIKTNKISLTEFLKFLKKYFH